jgi:3-dehydroquinate synthase
MREEFGPRRVALVSDANVAALWGERVRRALTGSGFAVEPLVVPAGETTKSLRHLGRLWDLLARIGHDRQGVVVALGGGVVGDLAGFAAASWLRGVEWVAVPTSLLAQVDSSVGGKTGIDLPAGKNLAGAFHQPRLVVIDPGVLSTLPERHLRAGLAEVIKCGMAVDAGLFTWLEAHAERLLAREPAALTEAIRRSVRVKAAVVRADEHERPGGARTALNYGHTVGHALETCLGYRRLLHGEAVAVGMRIAAGLSEALAGLPASDRTRQDRLLDRVGLSARIPGVAVGALLDAMARDKKRRNGMIRWVLTPRLGHASVPRLIPGRRVAAALIHAGARA